MCVLMGEIPSARPSRIAGILNGRTLRAPPFSYRESRAGHDGVIHAAALVGVLGYLRDVVFLTLDGVLKSIFRLLVGSVGVLLSCI